MSRDELVAEVALELRELARLGVGRPLPPVLVFIEEDADELMDWYESGMSVSQIADLVQQIV